ncbi:uncharacterized protein EI90DRAFT_3077263 [Cantharellus anzutake]|uniref:uncharacterized protein n=1 Tax=Cantharellus anzutake TaxID=1750568 RepID=UPI001904C9C9|nr:uncharacterized protein EI90DRAFT_3077263 [Cantharellus anzutake]KAF8322897.1 hypothetical protein EI90DRAFT_3077263 [Cantharellus anzutake]
MSVNLNCWVLGDGTGQVFSVKIASTESVIALKEAIKDKKKVALQHIDADALTLWKVSIPVDDGFEEKVKLQNELLPVKRFSSLVPQLDLPILELYCLICGGDANNIFPVKIASTESVGTFKKAIKEEKKVNLEHVDADSLTLWRVCIPVDYNFENAKGIDLKNEEMLSPAWGSSVSQEAPSSGGLPKKFVAIQKKEKPAFALIAPQPPLPRYPSHYHPIFSQFQDDCKTYTPTKKDHDFALKFSHSMSNIYANEGDRADQARKDFASYGLDFLPTGIGKYCTDGDLCYKGFCFALIEAKAELSTSGAEPLFEAAWYYSAFIRNHFDETCSRAHIGFAGAVLTIHPHLEVLAPMLPLFYHASNVDMRMQAAHFFGATKNAILALNSYYESELPHITSNPIITFPYPTDFDSPCSTTKYPFEYSSQLDENRLLFSGTVGDEKIFIKFTHRCSEDALLACFSLGCAPALKRCQPIAGGWYMVVMALIEDDYHELRHSEMKVLFKDEIEEKVQALRQQAFVHGDIRTTNVMVRKDGKPGILLVDFDWAGKIEEVRYPMNVNNVDIKRPTGAVDGELIKPDHDIDMIKYMFQ